MVLRESVREVGILSVFRRQIRLLLLCRRLNFLVVRSFLTVVCRVFGTHFLILVFYRCGASYDRVFLRSFWFVKGRLRFDLSVVLRNLRSSSNFFRLLLLLYRFASVVSLVRILSVSAFCTIAPLRAMFAAGFFVR